MNRCFDRLTELIHLDLEAARTYDEALNHLDEPDIREQIVAFRDDHLRHVHDLQEAMIELGGGVVVVSDEDDGLIEGNIALDGAGCRTSALRLALRVMGGSEVITTNAYDEALYDDLPPQVRRLVERHFADERRHLAFFDRAIVAGAGMA